MNINLTSKAKTLMLIISMVFLVGCQDKIPYRSTITPEQAVTTGGSSGGGGGEKERPTGAVAFKSDFCGCKNKKAVTFGNCASICASKNDDPSQEILYANFNVTEDISLNSSFGNVNGWCQTKLDSEDANPKCVLEAKDENGGKVEMDVVTSPGSNSIKASMNDLEEDKTYVITLIEVKSGAKSNSVQIVKYSSDTVGPLGPLKVAPISQYTCLYRPSALDDVGGAYYDNAFRVHFYFLPSIPPTPIPAGTEVVCHDIFNPLYGPIDDPLYPRLELIPGIYNLWDVTDYRFYDNNGNNNEDVNDLIIQKAKNLNGGSISIPTTTKFFQKFPTLTTVENNENSGNNTSAQSMGWYMAPWINTTTTRSYCLTNTEYNSSNVLFQAMKDFIGVDTEGIYVGVKAPETVFDRDGNPIVGPSDFILIRETDLKAVWFYLKNGVPTVPTDSNVSSVAVYFYYPLNKVSPFVKSSSQRIYQVKGANELSTTQGVSGGGSSSSGTSTNYPPHDRKIGCVPKF